jgi:hypothetical protein
MIFMKLDVNRSVKKLSNINIVIIKYYNILSFIYHIYHLLKKK